MSRCHFLSQLSYMMLLAQGSGVGFAIVSSHLSGRCVLARRVAKTGGLCISPL